MKKQLIFFCIFLLFAGKAYASENIITSLYINNEDETDIEIVVDKNKIYLPCKFILKYFSIPYKENHAQKSLTFLNTTIRQGIFNKTPVFFVKTGISGLQNEFFISADILSKILGKNILANSKQLAVYIKTKEDTIVKNDSDYNPFLIKKFDNSAKAFDDDISLPTKKGTISLDKVILRENMYSDTYSQIYKETQSKIAAFNNNLQLTLAGKLKSGEYSVDFGTNSYTNNMFGFSGISPKYKNKYKNFDYITGKVEPWKFAQNDISSDVMGIQIKTHVNTNENNFRSIEGHVDKSSIVRVCINDDFEKDISTYGGYFNLKNINYGKNINKIKLYEVKSNGTKNEILSKKYKNIDEIPTPNKDFILGINGLQNRLWASNGYIYWTNTQKFMAGAKFYKKLSDRLIFENFLTADRIFKSDSNNAWTQSILGNKRYLNYTTMQNQNALSGETYMGALTYNPNEKMKSKFMYGGSFSKSTDGFSKDGLGFFAQFDEIYNFNKEDNLKLSTFVISPGFYLAGFSGGNCFLSDRAGLSLNGSKNFKKISLNGGYSKYKSNFADYYEGGLMDFDDYNFNIRTNFKKLPTFGLRVNNKRGGNGIGEISSTSYDFNVTKHIKCFDFEGGMRGNKYSNQYSAEGYSSYKSNYSDIYSEARFPIGKHLGYFSLGHNIVKIFSDTTKNNYNSINFQYTTPQIKTLNFRTFLGFHYSGTNKGNDYGFGVTKRLKSGSTVSINYRFSQIPFYMVDNMYIPGSVRHSITIDFAELYGIGSHGLQSVGVGNENKGFVQITAFLDVNQNGKHDKGEPYIENIPFKIENESKPILTEKNGKTELKPEEKGIYNVKVFEDELPTLISCCTKTKSSQYVKVETGDKSKLSFGFVSTVGNITGSVTVKDEFENPLKVDDLIVSVIDTEGKEVTYTNLNDDGTFSFSGLNPGKYLVEVDKELQETYKIKPDLKSENYTVEIPPVYKDYVNIDNVNLNYVYSI